MKVLRFRAPRAAAAPLAAQIASLRALLAEYQVRQSAIREDGRRIKAAIDRLNRLSRVLARSQRRLSLSLGRLRSLQRSLGPRDQA
jgi:ABC-type transporter Mla subunit MlaD